MLTWRQFVLWFFKVWINRKYFSESNACQILLQNDAKFLIFQIFVIWSGKYFLLLLIQRKKYIDKKFSKLNFRPPSET